LRRRSFTNRLMAQRSHFIAPVGHFAHRHRGIISEEVNLTEEAFLATWKPAILFEAMQAPNYRAMERIRVIVADDFPEMFDAVEKCLTPDCEITEKVSDGVALVESARRLQADLLVTDISMPRLNGIEALRQLRGMSLQTPAIVLTINDDEELANEAFQAGAQGFVLKFQMGSDLRLAVREVLAGRTYTSEPARKKGPNRNN
jgi:CheY-like chemotaxis protein